MEPDSSCTLCAGALEKRSDTFRFQEDEILFFAKLITKLNLDSNCGDHDSKFSDITNLPYFFCYTCHQKVLGTMETFETFNQLKCSLRRVQTEVKKQVLASYHSKLTGSQHYSNQSDTLRANLVERFVLNYNADAKEGACGASSNHTFSDSDAHALPIFITSETKEELEICADDSADDETFFHLVSNDDAETESCAPPTQQIEEAEMESCAPPAQIEVFVLKPFSIHLGKRVSPLQCSHSECCATFGTETALRRHAEAHAPPEVKSQRRIQLPDEDAMALAMETTTNYAYPTKCQIPGCASTTLFPSSARLRRHISGVHFYTELGKSEVDTELDKLIGLTYPTRCPIVGCSSTNTFAYRGLLRSHFKRAHVGNSENSAGNSNSAESASEREVLLSAKKLALPTPCPLDNCYTNAIYKRRCNLLDHVRGHFSLNRQFMEVESVELRAELMAAHAMEYPTQCPKASCASTTIFKSRHLLKRHIRGVHFPEEKEPKGVNSKLEKLQKTFRKVQDLKFPAKCIFPDCEHVTAFPRAFDLRKHIREEHFQNLNFENGSKNEQNSEIQAEPSSESQNEAMETTIPSKGTGEHKCGECDRHFLNLKSLNHHRQLKHNKSRRNFQCDECGKAFLGSGSLKEHIYVKHSAHPPSFLCSFCPKTFKLKSSLHIHLKRHTGDFKFFCSVCPRGFIFRQALEAHERGVHWEQLGIEPFRCKTCGKLFLKPQTLQMHEHSHTGTGAFSCSQCAYNTDRKNDMREHVDTVHGTETPYACATCGKAFKLERRLRQHMRTHVQEYPYACEVCQNRFASPSSLRVHKEKRHGQQPTGENIGYVAGC